MSGHPVTFVTHAIAPLENAKSVLLTIHIVSRIDLTVCELIATQAMFQRNFPLTGIPITSDAAPGSTAMNLELASEFGAIWPGVFSCAMFCAPQEVPSISGRVSPCGFTKTSRLVIHPFTCIGDAFFIIVNPQAVRLGVPPLTDIENAIGVFERSFAAGHVILPEALVVSTIWPHLKSKSTSLGTHPLAIVISSASEDVFPARSFDGPLHLPELWDLRLKVVFPVGTPTSEKRPFAITSCSQVCFRPPRTGGS
mmetsp:Transcript_61346/g.124477  ORF Transcript_61346/g.124477 Transcript_61346/m.124477 type:complete len:253 (-) Transcript_61346:124-882(-)